LFTWYIEVYNVHEKNVTVHQLQMFQPILDSVLTQYSVPSWQALWIMCF